MFALLELGKTLLEVGQAQVAAKCLGKLLKLAPDQAQVHHVFGIACLRINQLDKALEHCQQALQLQPDLIEARCDLVRIYFRQGQYWTAIKQVWGILVLSVRSRASAQYLLDHLKKRLIH